MKCQSKFEGQGRDQRRPRERHSMATRESRRDGGARSSRVRDKAADSLWGQSAASRAGAMPAATSRTSSILTGKSAGSGTAEPRGSLPLRVIAPSNNATRETQPSEWRPASTAGAHDAAFATGSGTPSWSRVMSQRKVAKERQRLTRANHMQRHRSMNIISSRFET